MYDLLRMVSCKIYENTTQLLKTLLRSIRVLYEKDSTGIKKLNTTTSTLISFRVPATHILLFISRLIQQIYIINKILNKMKNETCRLDY